MSIASSLSAAFFMFSIVAVLLLLTSLVGAQEPTYLSLAEKTYPKPTTVRAPGFELASSIFDDFESFPEDNLKHYGREPRGPLEVRNVLYKVQLPRENAMDELMTRIRFQKADNQHDRAARQSEIVVDKLHETSGITVSSVSSANYRPPPPPVRRDVFMNARCSFDPEQWAMHPQSSISNAIMFYRLTGVSCQKCLKICQSKQKKPWACRSVNYDHRWAICDLFAVTSSASTFTLVDYKGRDYFEYLAATPPVGDDLLEAHAFSHKEEEESTIIDCKRVLDQEKKKAAAGVKNFEKSPRTATSYGAVPITIPESKKKPVKTHNYMTEKVTINFKNRSPEVRSGETLSSSQASSDNDFKEESQEEIRDLGERIENESLELFSTTTEKPRGMSVRHHVTLPTTYRPKKTFVPTATTIFPEIEEDFSVVTPNYLRTTQREATEVSAEMRVRQSVPPPTTVSPIASRPITNYADRKHFEAIRQTLADDEQNERLIDAIKEELGNGLHEDYKPDSVCSDNRHVVMIDFVSTSRAPFSTPVRRLLARSLEECRGFCANDPNCSSAIYAPSVCELATTKANYQQNELVYSPSCSYSLKLCLPYRDIPTTGPITAFMNFMLIGNVEVVETTSSLENCVIACLDAYDIYDVHCESAMFIADDKQQNCILNSASRLTDPKSFVPVYEMNGVASKFVYFEFRQQPERAAFKRINRRLKDNIDYNFTKWSTCLYNSTSNESYGRKYKYEKCSLDDIRKCPKHSTLCTAKSVSN